MGRLPSVWWISPRQDRAEVQRLYRAGLRSCAAHKGLCMLMRVSQHSVGVPSYTGWDFWVGVLWLV